MTGKETSVLTLSLVGCGAISRKHIEALAALKQEIQIVAVCDVVRANAENIARLCQSSVQVEPIIYGDHRHLLAIQRPDIVAIATSSFTHCTIGLDALRAGCHVIFEKPLALSTRDMDLLIREARAQKRAATVCYITRFAPHIRELRAAKQRGWFGRLLAGSITVHWNRGDDYYMKAPWRGTWENDGGMLMNQCTHGIDLLQWMIGGQAVRIHAVARRFLRPVESEDFASAIVEFDNGAIGNIIGTVAVYPANLDESLRFFGEHGTVVIGGTHMEKVETWQFRASKGYVPPSPEGAAGHTALYQDFVSAIQEDRDPLVTLEDARRSVDIVLAAYESVKEKRTVTMPVDFSTEEMKGVSI